MGMPVISPSVLSKVVKTITPKNERVEESQFRGTIVFSGGEHYIQLDGAPNDSLTPIANIEEGASDSGFVHGDRVLVLIKNHQAIVTKNLTTGLQAQAAKDASAFTTAITDEGITAQRIIANDTFTNTLRANDITADEIVAGMATIDSLDTTYAHITNGVIDNAKIGHADVNGLNANYAHITSGVIDNAKIDQADVNNLSANYAHVTNGVIDTATIDQAKVNNLSANYAHTTNGIIDNAKIGHADVNGLNANYAHVTNGVIDNAKIGHADVNGLNANYAHVTNGVIDNAEIGYADVNGLNANYAEIDLANVNNAWIQNGVVKDAAISDAQIIGVSANKLTAGTIDASNITVTNLNADNITAGTLNGQRIGQGSLSLDKLNQEVPTKTYVDNELENLQGQIDGQIETWTGSVVPTLQNSPAVNWGNNSEKHKHVGDIYYVVNASNSADGYTYRFTESGTAANPTYSWTLIKDNQITKALQDILDIQGDISDIQTFDTQISSWKTDTDSELTSLKSKTSTLETNLGNKVDTTTFNELSQTVDENSSSITSLTTTVNNKADSSTVTTLSNTVSSIQQTANSNSSTISQLTTTLGTNADGTTKANDIVHKVSAVQQDLSGFHTTVEETYATKTSVNGKADASTVYTKSEIDQTVSGINASVSAKADGQETTAALALKANKATLTSEINASADTVRIDADRVNIEGATIFTSGRLSQTSLNSAYDSKGAAATAKAEAIAEIPTNVSELTNDAGYQNETQVSNAITSGVSGKADKTAAVSEEQYIYISKASGTSSVSENNTWVTRSDDVQNTWTTKRPTYNPSYPVLFVAKQKKVVSGTVTCTTPVKDDTTTVIDGGHITTGTIDASQVTVTNLNASNITSGTLNADRIGAGSITISNVDSTIQNAVETAQNTFIFDTTYTMSGTIASFEAHLYKGGVDVKEYVDGNNDPLYPPSMFTWYLKHEDSQTQQGDYIGYGYRINVNLSTCNYGAEVIAHFTTTDDSPLLNVNDDNLTDANNNTLTGRTESGESVRVRDLTVTTSLSGADKLMVIGAEDEHLVSINTLQAYLNANLDKQVKFNTTAGWNSQTSLVSQVNTLYVYTDHQVDSQGRNVAGIKVGDGLAYVVDLPFTDAIATEHIANTTAHITSAERAAWNSKVRCYYSGVENLVFTTA